MRDVMIELSIGIRQRPASMFSILVHGFNRVSVILFCIASVSGVQLSGTGISQCNSPCVLLTVAGLCGYAQVSSKTPHSSMPVQTFNGAEDLGIVATLYFLLSEGVQARSQG